MIDFNIKDYMKSILPGGQYTFKIVDVNLKPTKNNPECRYVSITLEVISDFKKGARIFDNFNIYHVKEMVQNIGRSQLAELCNAAGITKLNLVSDLIDCIVDAIVSEDSYNGQPKNKIDKYLEAKTKDLYANLVKDDVPFDNDIKF